MSQFTLHIFLSSIENETRLYKEAQYTLSQAICSRVAVLGLWQEGLKKEEVTEYGLEIYRHPTLIRRLKSKLLVKRLGIVRKLLALISVMEYAISCITGARQMRPDHVSCHNAAMLPVAWAAAKLAGATLEYLPHELETQRSGLTGLAKRITVLVERRFIHSARNVVVVCDPIRDWYEKTYGLKNLYIVRNVPEREAVQIKPVAEGNFRSRFSIPNSAKIFIYQGLFSAGRGIEMLLETFADLDANRCHLVLMGYGDDSSQSMINDAVNARTNIHFQPAVAREWIVSYSASADIGLWISEKASLSYRYALPNKFFEYAHAGIPMLVSDNLEYQAGLLREGDFGWSTPLEKLETMILELSEVDLKPFRNNARQYASSAIWENDARSFSTIYARK